MARKLHRRTSQRQFFPEGAQGGTYGTIHKTGKGIRDRLESSREVFYKGLFDGKDSVPYHRADEILRLVEAGFSDDDIAEMLLIPVEDIDAVIRDDAEREEKAEWLIKTLFADL